MRCPYCGSYENMVVDSRLKKTTNVIRRRRQCNSCHKRFTTHERVEDILPLVIKADGRREPFDRNKILSGVQKACQKRPVSVEAMENLVEKIEQYIQDSGERELKGSVVGEKVMQGLYDLDEVAYVRFASVYRQFKDIGDFMAEVKELLINKDKEEEK